jgi:hypothetical protein
MTTNFSKVQKWAKTLDNCMKLWQIQERTDDIYGDPDTLSFDDGPGLSYAAGPTFNYFMGWKQQAGCPTA